MGYYSLPAQYNHNNQDWRSSSYEHRDYDKDYDSDCGRHHKWDDKGHDYGRVKDYDRDVYYRYNTNYSVNYSSSYNDSWEYSY